MGHDRVRHLVNKPDGRSYWQPTAKMRAAGFQMVRLTGTPAVRIAKAAALNARWDQYRLNGVDLNEPMPGTIAAFRLKYTGKWDKRRRVWSREPSPEFKKLGGRTQRDYNQWLDAFEADFGDLPPGAVDAKAIKDNYHATVETRGAYAGFHLIGVVRTFFAWLVSESELTVNAASAVKVHKPKSRKVRWLPEQRDRQIGKADEMGRASIALATMLADWLAQRPFDVRSLKWSNYDGRAIVGIVQAKTGTELPPIPLSPELRNRLDATPKTSTHIIVNEDTGRPYAESTFQRAFAEVRRAASLPDDLKFVDFRRTALTEIVGQEATDDEARAISGHLDRNVLSVYALPSAEAAANAMRKRLRGRTKEAKKTARRGPKV